LDPIRLKIIAAKTQSFVVVEGFRISVSNCLPSPRINLLIGVIKLDPFPLMVATITGTKSGDPPGLAVSPSFKPKF
jgi:hypothetical protein